MHSALSSFIFRACCLCLLLTVGFHCKAMNSTSDHFKRVLSSAINGDKQQLQQIIQAGETIDVADQDGRSVVLVVTLQNRLDALQLLIELGADVDYYDKSLSAEVIDQTAFLYAAAHGMNEALVLLLNAGARPDILNYYGGTGLIPAAEKGHVSSVKLLLEKSKIDVNHVNNLGWTALMEAVILSDPGIAQQQIVALLLAHGADPEITDKDGVSALQHARNRGYTELIELLTK